MIYFILGLVEAGFEKRHLVRQILLTTNRVLEIAPNPIIQVLSVLQFQVLLIGEDIVSVLILLSTIRPEDFRGYLIDSKPCSPRDG